MQPFSNTGVPTSSFRSSSCDCRIHSISYKRSRWHEMSISFSVKRRPRKPQIQILYPSASIRAVRRNCQNKFATYAWTWKHLPKVHCVHVVHWQTAPHTEHSQFKSPFLGYSAYPIGTTPSRQRGKHGKIHIRPQRLQNQTLSNCLPPQIPL